MKAANVTRVGYWLTQLPLLYLHHCVIRKIARKTYTKELLKSLKYKVMLQMKSILPEYKTLFRAECLCPPKMLKSNSQRLEIGPSGGSYGIRIAPTGVGLVPYRCPIQCLTRKS